jgi:outer membrane protein OmpA-like peptidoglycan-associated protein
MAALQSDLGGQVAEATRLAEERAQSMAAAQSAHEDTMSEARGRIFALEEELKSERTTLAALEEKLKLSVADLTGKLEQGEQALAAAKSELESALAQSAEQKRTLETQIGDLSTAKQGLEGEIETAKGRIAGLDADLTAARTELESAKTQAAEVKQALEAKVAALEGTKQTLAGEIETAKARIGELDGSLAATRSELETAAAQALEQKRLLEGQIDSLSADKGALLKAVETAKGQIAGLEGTVATERQAAAATRAADLAASEQAHTRLRGLYTRFAELGGRRTDRGMLLRLDEDELRFQKGMAVLPKGAQPSLDSLATLLAEHRELSARIEGHTDNAGPEAINLELSQARAEAVKQALIERGVQAERLAAKGEGEARPVADNSTQAGRGQNRRVEVYVIEGGK